MRKPWRGRPKTPDRFQDWSQAKKDRYLASFRLLYAIKPEQVARAEQQIAALAPEKRREIRRPVDQKPVHRSEHQEQSEVVSWWNLICHTYKLPAFALFAIPNGGARDMITGAMLKREGVRRGAFDLCLAAARNGHHGLYIEMKVGNNKPSDEQEKFKEYLNSAGYKASVHWDAKSAIDAIEQYLAQ